MNDRRRPVFDAGTGRWISGALDFETGEAVADLIERGKARVTAVHPWGVTVELVDGYETGGVSISAKDVQEALKRAEEGE